MSVEKKTEANVKQAVPFFGVSNMEESLRFYVEGLGFRDDQEMDRRRANSAGVGWRSATRL